MIHNEIIESFKLSPEAKMKRKEMVTELLRKNARDPLWKHAVMWTGTCSD